MWKLRALVFSLVVGYMFIPQLAVNAIFAQRRQGDELGRTALCCSPLICTEIQLPDFGPVGNWIVMAIAVAFLILLMIMAGTADAKKAAPPVPQAPPPPKAYEVKVPPGPCGGAVLAEGDTPEQAIAKLPPAEHGKLELWSKGVYVAELEWIPTLVGPRLNIHWVGD